MKATPIAWSLCVLALVVLAIVGGYATTSAAQKTGDKSEAADSDAKAPTPRLPNYYGRVATDEQKPKLRDVVKQYAPRIQQKREELQALLAERDAALDEILSAEQRDEIAKLREAAAAQRASSSDGGSETKTKSKKAKTKAKKAA
jgi:hypothetical protein